MHHPEIDERVNALVSQMTLEEKISQMMHAAPAIPRLGIPAYNWWNECLHGVGRAGIATVFPQAIGLAATFNPELIERVATAISDEARAKHHEALRNDSHGIYEGLTFWSPNINIFRDPRWGRGQETYGEDPYLTSRMAVAFIKGLQGDNPKYLKVVATAKHYAVYSGPEASRHHFNAVVSEQDLNETYLPAFKACVEEANVASVMTAYNRTNGEACTASHKLIQEILREKWGFDGYVVTDCWAVEDIFMRHKIAKDAAEASAQAVSAGTDLECGCAFDALLEAVEAGLVTEGRITEAVTRLFKARFQLGMFDEPAEVPYAQIAFDRVDCKWHRALAKRVARESMVLLKNDGILPIVKDVDTIAVIGPNADDAAVLLGNYNGTPSFIVTPLEGIRDRFKGKTLHAKGCGVVNPDKTRFKEALEIAQQADLIIFVAGLSQAVEGEDGQDEGVPTGTKSQGDRDSLSLPGVQEELLKELHATGKPVVLVLLNGSPIALDWASENVAAILEAWYPGQDGGSAIASVLFGDYNPGGKLPVTFYSAQQTLPDFSDYRMDRRTYRFMGPHDKPVYPFGYGLSFCEFTYSDLQYSVENGELVVRVIVENTGYCAADEVVMVYASHNYAGHAPQKALVGFFRLHMRPQRPQRIRVPLDRRAYTLYDDQGNPYFGSGEIELIVGECGITVQIDPKTGSPLLPVG